MVQKKTIVSSSSALTLWDAQGLGLPVGRQTARPPRRISPDALKAWMDEVDRVIAERRRRRKRGRRGA